MFDLPDDWVWDFWLADDGATFHLFFLKAPRSLGDSDLRHDHAAIGHAVSDDLRRWSVVADPVQPQPDGYDDLAMWTGSVVRAGDHWRMFRTGRTRSDGGSVQRIGCDTSPDLVTWARDRAQTWPLAADPRHYDVGDGTVHWRDPWVVRDDVSGLWHMYVTARAAGVGAGVVGHAVSEDLSAWQVQPPLSEPTGCFDWLEVISVVEVEGRWVLLFSCLSAEMPEAASGAGGVWSVPIAGPGAPVDVTAAVRVTDERLYVGKVVQDRSGRWQFLAFVNQDDHGRFVGGVTDPVPVRWRSDARGLELDMAPPQVGRLP
jgi:beta-fructofuranosidase